MQTRPCFCESSRLNALLLFQTNLHVLSRRRRAPLTHRRSLRWPRNHATCAQQPTPAKPPNSPSKRPYGYWKHLPNVLSELETHLSSFHPQPTAMPTAHELTVAGRPDLAGAIRRHTWRKVAAAANLPLSSHARPRSLNLSFCTDLHTNRIKPHMYWRDWKNVEKELRQFILSRNGHSHERDAMVMPTAAELVNQGRSGLKRAISLHGGVKEVARKLGLVPKSKPAQYWNEERVVHELRRVMKCVGTEGVFPAADEVREFGKRGLQSAVRRLGGARALAKDMGLTRRRRVKKG